jgi:hypothetical protein
MKREDRQRGPVSFRGEDHTPLSLDDLIDTACEACGCDDPNCGLMFKSRCHPKAGVDAKFFKARMVFALYCHQCGQEVEAISLVQEKPS